MQKLYCFADETGPDASSSYLLVVACIANQDAFAYVEKTLTDIERSSKKFKLKWHKSRPERRRSYIEQVMVIKELQGALFYRSTTQPDDPSVFAADVIIAGVSETASPPYFVRVFIDGLQEAAINVVKQRLKKAAIPYSVVRGLRDESSAFIRLCDALAGLLRDADEGHEYAAALAGRLRKKKILKKI